MPGQKNDLRNAEANDQPDVNLSYEELMAEISSELQRYPPLEETDITIAKLIDETGRSDAWLRELMRRKVAAGKWKVVYKRNHLGFKTATYVKVL